MHTPGGENLGVCVGGQGCHPRILPTGEMRQVHGYDTGLPEMPSNKGQVSGEVQEERWLPAGDVESHGRDHE